MALCISLKGIGRCNANILFDHFNPSMVQCLLTMYCIMIIVTNERVGYNLGVALTTQIWFVVATTETTCNKYCCSKSSFV